ncbi:MAG TPA: OmpA family protein, partial [Steroidobacteraceae bacterium]|nr:OmpA family protein [Steroidobacteraceae bacterium]
MPGRGTWLLKAAIAAMLLGLGAANAQGEESEFVRGRVIDDGTQTVVAPGHNEEFNTSLEALWGHSDVLTRDAKKMRANADSLPKTQVSKSETLSDADLGALFESGRDELLPASRAQLDRIASELRQKQHLRFLIVGHADAQRLSPRTRAIFKDNQGLSEARAFQVAQYLRAKLNLPAEAFTIRGEGDRVPVADNTTPQGMAKNRRVEVQVWFDQNEVTRAQAPVPSLASTCYTQDVTPTDQPMRISVDGQPVDETVPSEADHQRCVDVATDQHHIQIQFDPLNTDAALNVWAWPSEVVPGHPVEFHTYSNYVHWIRNAEVRLFAPGQDSREKPIQVLPIKIGSSIAWTPDRTIPTDSLFLLRVYDDKGRFDETALKPLTIVDRARPLGDEESAQRERLTGYGENSLRVRNIRAIGGSVTVSGSDVANGDVVTALGAQVPVDAHGRFVTRQLLPAGTHTVEVETRAADGDFTRYSRNLTVAGDTFFYVTLGELTAAKNHTTGPAELVTQDSDTYQHESPVTGRGAFYVKGKIKQDYLLTASADTRERPIEDLFSNFTSKDPRFLLERIDAERAYPVYGDDSTSEWDAPTNGRFYARIEHRDSRAMWGNFQSSWTGLELNQFSRSLYGADLLLKSDAATSFGERRFTNDAFAAEPGTLNSREEFRGTGGSLYYLHRQDITRGSERLWIEVRDATSGIALQRTQLIPGQDYEMSYLQGRILLRAPLSSEADSVSLVQLGSLSGNPAYLVATYEYTPGLNEADSNVYGLRNSTWLNDYVRVGVSGYRQGD